MRKRAACASDEPHERRAACEPPPAIGTAEALGGEKNARRRAGADATASNGGGTVVGGKISADDVKSVLQRMSARGVVPDEHSYRTAIRVLASVDAVPVWLVKDRRPRAEPVSA